MDGCTSLQTVTLRLPLNVARVIMLLSGCLVDDWKHTAAEAERSTRHTARKHKSHWHSAQIHPVSMTTIRRDDDKFVAGWCCSTGLQIRIWVRLWFDSIHYCCDFLSSQTRHRWNNRPLTYRMSTFSANIIATKWVVGLCYTCTNLRVIILFSSRRPIFGMLMDDRPNHHLCSKVTIIGQRSWSLEVFRIWMKSINWQVKVKLGKPVTAQADFNWKAELNWNGK